ncbi:acyl-CoA dehydrogenase family protein [Pseudonocardia sp. NPDC049154]|uniref:acyl-CoA dehydrogenase family protein n=1 Tax=Pseudonocardia sp. NPDC049154 TaxID=3155501 RepID=UPI0033C1495D
MEFGWSETEQKYRAELRAFIDAEVPGWRANPVHKRVITPEEKARVVDFTHKLAERGWLTPAWPKEYGGGEQSAWQSVILSEEMWSVGEPRGSQYMSVNWIGPAIMLAGTEEQKREHLSRISRGEAFWSQGFSEPEAGSDLASLRTRAVREGGEDDGEYVVNGQKIWTSHTPSAEWLFLLVRTDPDAAKQRGISILLLPIDTPGVEVRTIPDIVGEGAFAEIFFTDVRVPASARLGPENGGWPIVRRALQFERVGAARWERAALVLDLLAERAAKEGLLAGADVARRFGEARAFVEAARWMVYRVVDERAKEIEGTATAYPARAAMVRAERLVAELGLDVFGPEALVAETFEDSTYRQALTAGIAGGSYEIQLNLIAGQILGLPRS